MVAGCKNVIAQLAPGTIDIPIAIDIRPFYQFANNYIDTLYTNPGFPEGWIEEGCDKRYQYRFVRGPISFVASNDVLLGKFTGSYGVRGSTRICTSLGNTPWTPPCSCGFGSERPRKVGAGFGASIRLLSNYGFDIRLQSTNPTPLDKCELCAFGIDVTKTVVAQVRQELDASLKETAAMMKSFSLKPYMQQLWDTLQTGFAIEGYGRLVLHPKAIRISKLQLRRDSLYLSIGLSVSPELSPVSRPAYLPLPDLSDFSFRNGFFLSIAQVMPYDTLDAMLNGAIAGKEIVMGKGIVSKKIVIDSAHLQKEGGRVRISMYSSRGLQGQFSLLGTPRWDSAKNQLYFDSLAHEISLEQRVLQNISSLFDKSILRKLQELTTIDLASKTDSLKIKLNELMNEELYKGVKASGGVEQLSLTSLQAVESGIFISGYCKVALQFKVNVSPF